MINEPPSVSSVPANRLNHVSLWPGCRVRRLLGGEMDDLDTDFNSQKSGNPKSFIHGGKKSRHQQTQITLKAFLIGIETW